MKKYDMKPFLDVMDNAIKNLNDIMKKPDHRTVEEFIQEKDDREELRRLRNFKRNVLANVVFDIDDKLLEILETYETKDL